MTDTILTIKRWGNGMGVRLPQAVAREAQLYVGQQVRMVVEAGRLIVQPLPARSMSLEERLRRFNPARHGGEVV